MVKDCIKQTLKCRNHRENDCFLTTDRLTSILDVTSSSRDLVNDSQKLKNTVKIRGETKNFVERMKENHKLEL